MDWVLRDNGIRHERVKSEIGFVREELKEKAMLLEHYSDATPVNAKVAVHVKVQNSAKFLKKNEEHRILVYQLLQIPSTQIIIASLQN